MITTKMRSLWTLASSIFKRSTNTSGTTSIGIEDVSLHTVYSAACQHFVKSAGHTTLHPVSSIDEKDNVQPFQLVVKSTQRRFIFGEKNVYQPSEFQLTDILTTREPLTCKVSTQTMISDYSRKATLSLTGKLGVGISKHLIVSAIDLKAKDSISLNIKFGEVTKMEVNDPDLISNLTNRYIDLCHPYIQQIREDENKVLCLVKGVSTLKYGGVIQREDDIGASTTLNLKVPILTKSSSGIGTSYSQARDVTLPPLTPVAYNVLELIVCPNDGAIQLVLTTGSSGGFRELGNADVEMNDNQDNSELRKRGKLDLDLRHPRAVFSPLLQLSTHKRSQLTHNLLSLLSVPRDLCILADIIVSAETGSLDPMSLSSLQDQLLSPMVTWKTLLELVGMEFTDNIITPPREVTPMLHCIAELLDAVTVLDDDLLHLIRLCSQDLAQLLLVVLPAGIKGESTTDPAIVQPLLNNHICTKILEDLDFILLTEEIAAPKSLPFSIDEVFWILFALWGKE